VTRFPVVETALTEELLRGWPLPQPDADSDKHDRGQILVVAGSVPVPGAAILAGTAALRAGAGKLQVATTRATAVGLGMQLPEALVAGFDETPDGGIAPAAAARIAGMAAGAAAVLIGPGMVDDEAVAELVHGILDALPADAPLLVLDAAAVTSLGPAPTVLRHLGGRVVLTPNEGELASLLHEGSPGDDPPDRGTAARVVAATVNAVVAARGCIASPDARTWRYLGGGPELGTSGSGDVLAGIVTGLAATGASPAQAACWGVHVHARAGQRVQQRIGGLGILAR
jgi:hydroxyethylthiazole kinase-like uncharacterized protein yjeF